MIRAATAAACAVLVSFTVPADACWNRDGHGWRSAGYGYGYRDGWGYRGHRAWVGTGYGYGYRDGWRRHHWRGEGYGYRSGVAVGVRSGEGWERGRHWRGDRGEHMIRERREATEKIEK